MDVLSNAVSALSGAGEAVGEDRTRVRAALEGLAAGAASAQAREACRRADDALGLLLGLLRDTARTLGDDAGEQRVRFHRAGSR